MSRKMISLNPGLSIFRGEWLVTLCFLLAFAVPHIRAAAPEFHFAGRFSKPDGRIDLRFDKLKSDPQTYLVLYRGNNVTNITEAVDVAEVANKEALHCFLRPDQLGSFFFRVASISLSSPLDSDGDGIDDTYELSHRLLLDPLSPVDATEDFDHDGKTNLQEYKAGTNPCAGRPRQHTISAGTYHGLAIQEDGSLWNFGKLSASVPDGPILNRFLPARIGTSKDWQGLACAGSACFGTKTDGTLWAWGGTWTVGDQYNNWIDPVQIAGAGWAKIIAISSTLWAIRTNGTMWQWIGPQQGLTQFGIDSDWAEIAGFYGHILAIKADGSLWAWGNNFSGELGLGTFGPEERRLTPVRVGTNSNWAVVAAGQAISLAIRMDGTLWGWGTGNLLPGSSLENFPTPLQLDPGNDWVRIQPGIYFCLALKKDNSLWAWGSNETGSLGLGTSSSDIAKRPARPVRVGDASDWIDVACGARYSIALKTNGTLWSWGYNIDGPLGSFDHSVHIAPGQVGLDTNWTQVAAGDRHSAGVKIDGSLWTWGVNPFGQLGDGSFDDTDSPRRIGNETNWVRASIGPDNFFNTMALKDDGTLWGWGLASQQLSAITNTPSKIEATHAWSAAVASTRPFALSADGSLWNWPGYVPIWQTPSRWDVGTGWLAIANGFYGIKTDLTLWQLNQNNTITPLEGSDWVDCSSGRSHAIALKADGSLWEWGATDYVNITILDGFAVSILNQPTRVGSETNWVAIGHGNYHALAIKRDGSLWAWGLNMAGQLGTGTMLKSKAPLRVGTDYDWKSIVGGGRHSLGTKRNGTLWAWGENHFGQLGLPATWRPYPIAGNALWKIPEKK